MWSCNKSFKKNSKKFLETFDNPDRRIPVSGFVTISNLEKSNFSNICTAVLKSFIILSVVLSLKL